MEMMTQITSIKDLHLRNWLGLNCFYCRLIRAALLIFCDSIVSKDVAFDFVFVDDFPSICLMWRCKISVVSILYKLMHDVYLQETRYTLHCFVFGKKFTFEFIHFYESTTLYEYVHKYIKIRYHLHKWLSYHVSLLVLLNKFHWF